MSYDYTRTRYDVYVYAVPTTEGNAVDVVDRIAKQHDRALSDARKFGISTDDNDWLKIRNTGDAVELYFTVPVEIRPEDETYDKLKGIFNEMLDDLATAQTCPVYGSLEKGVFANIRNKYIRAAREI